MNSVSKTEKGHGRIETRSAFTTNDVSWMPGGRQWPGLKCIGAIKTHFEYKGKGYGGVALLYIKQTINSSRPASSCENGMGH